MSSKTFLLLLPLATQWKNFEFLPPSTNHFILDFWRHSYSSFRRAFQKSAKIFNLSSFIAADHPLVEALLSISTNFSSRALMETKFCLLQPAQVLIFCLEAFNLSCNTRLLDPKILHPVHPFLTSNINSLSSRQPLKKRKGLGPHLSLLTPKVIALWFEIDLDRPFCTMVGNQVRKIGDTKKQSRHA